MRRLWRHCKRSPWKKEKHYVMMAPVDPVPLSCRGGKMALPKQIDIEIPLLKVLDRRGRPGNPTKRLSSG